MAFTRYKVINGRVYVSLEERYRDGRKVKSRYLRSLGSFIRRQSGSAGEVQEMRAMEAQFYKDKVQREEQATKLAEFKAHEEQMVHEERLIAPDPVPCWEPREVKDSLDKQQETQAPSAEVNDGVSVTGGAGGGDAGLGVEGSHNSSPSDADTNEGEGDK